MEDNPEDAGNPFDLFGRMFEHSGWDSGFYDGRYFREHQEPDLSCNLSITLREAVLGCEKLLSFQDAGIGTVNVKIPAGISEGTTLRLNRNGNPGRSRKSGDILLKVHIEDDPEYTRKGNDIYTNAKIPCTLAALGGEFRFSTLYGPVSCKIPAGSQSGMKIRLKGKGVVSAGNPHIYGDEYVVLQITVPVNMSERERMLFKELKTIEKY